MTPRGPMLLAWAAIGGLVLVFALVLVVQVYGREKSPPSLASNPQPDIPGEILFEDQQRCVYRIPAAGGERTLVTCDHKYPGAFTWIDPNTVGFVPHSPEPNPQSVIELDLETGAVEEAQRTVTIRPGAGSITPFSPQGEEAFITPEMELWVAKDGQRQFVADLPKFEGSRLGNLIDCCYGYFVRPLLWSPDGNWIMVYAELGDYDKAEIWLFSRDGRTSGTLVSGLDSPRFSWIIEGAGVTPRVLE